MSTELVDTGLEELENIETALFDRREQVEVLWLEMGELCSRIVRGKLYRKKQDENGNYFRTAKPYFQSLEKRFRERGMNMSYTSLNRWVSDHRLFVEDMKLPQEDLLLIGKSGLDELAPAIRKLRKEGKPEEADKLVQDVLGAARANGGLPLHEVRNAVDDTTGRITKGMQVEFIDGMFGKRLKTLRLFWGNDILDLMKAEVSEEQADWVLKRMGVKVITAS